MESRVPPRYIPFDASKTYFLSLQLNLLPFLYPLVNSLKRELAPSVTARVKTIHRASEKGHSRKLSFRHRGFSETENARRHDDELGLRTLSHNLASNCQ